jgi:hypothetical protein
VVGADSVTSTSRITLHGVSLLEGYVKIETIRSISTTTSIGSAASSTGDVDVVGMKIGGVDVSVTDDGFQVTGLPPGASQLPGAGGEPFPGQSPEQIVNSVLKSFGARITLFNSVSKVSGGRAERIEPGLVLSLDNPVGGTGPIPPGRFDIILASSSSSALATPPYTSNLPSVRTGAGLPSGGGSSTSIGEGPVVGGETVNAVGEQLSQAASGPSGAPAQTTGTLEGAEPQLQRYRFDGVPIGMVIALLLLSLLVARYLRNFLDRMMVSAGNERGEG